MTISVVLHANDAAIALIKSSDRLSPSVAKEIIALLCYLKKATPLPLLQDKKWPLTIGRALLMAID